MFHSLVRVWGRARSGLARRWETDTQLPCHYGAPGRGAQRAAWLSSFRAEASARDDKAHGQALMDLIKAFEHIRYSVLWDAGIRHRYPLRLLRLSIASYRGGRLLQVDGGGGGCGPGLSGHRRRLILRHLGAEVGHGGPRAEPHGSLPGGRIDALRRRLDRRERRPGRPAASLLTSCPPFSTVKSST